MNKCRNVDGLERIYDVKNKFVNFCEQKDETLNEYQYGFRFFYWPWYKNNENEFDHAMFIKEKMFMFDNRVDHRTPNLIMKYKLKDFYIGKKFATLKSELLLNSVCHLNVVQWAQLNKTAAYHKNTIFYRSYCCPRGQSAQFYYDMRHGALLTVGHFIAMMVYCNFDKLQREFSETYRKNSAQETIEDIKSKHRNYCNFGRLLREIVECFGMKQRNFGGIFKVYHGANGSFYFDSLYAFINIPFSTTLNYSVAVNFATQGTIMELNVDTTAWGIHFSEGEEARKTLSCFDCSLVSDYPAEEEIFFIGGQRMFHFNTVIRTDVCQNYVRYIRGLYHMTSGMFNGVGMEHICLSETPSTKEEIQLVFRLLSHQFYKHVPNHPDAHEFKSCPLLIRQLMDSHCKQVARIRCDEIMHKAFHYFFTFDNDWINLNDIMAIFPNTNTIEWHGYSKDILYVKKNISVIFQSILTFIKKDLNKINVTGYIIKFDPKFEAEIKGMIAPYLDKFKQIGWDISYDFEIEFKGLAWSKMLKEKCRTNPMERWMFTEQLKKPEYANVFAQLVPQELSPNDDALNNPRTLAVRIYHCP